MPVDFSAEKHVTRTVGRQALGGDTDPGGGMSAISVAGMLSFPSKHRIGLP
jgi:hypothetical protein